MTRSRRKTPIFGHTTCTSEKQDKREACRRLRRKVRLALKKRDQQLPEMRSVSDVWNFGKDGKSYFNKDYTDRDMRK